MPQEYNKKSHDLNTLHGRLLLCVDKAGGKRALADRSKISEAQLFRYINQHNDIPGERIIAIAEAANVHPGWLLTGDKVETSKSIKLQPIFRPQLLQYVIRLTDEILVEYQRAFSPRFKSSLIAVLYETLRHEEILQRKEAVPNKFRLFGIISFLEAFRTEAMLDLYHQAITLIEYEPQVSSDNNELLRTFCRLISQGYESYYCSEHGKTYYNRMGYDLTEEAQERLARWVSTAIQSLGRSKLKGLDLGCGNGRHIAYLHHKFPALELCGTEISMKAIELCKSLELQGKLPKDCVKQADACNLPFSNNALDFVHTRHVLQLLPYIPNTGHGLESAWKEMHRVLVPGGFVFMTHFQGEGRYYSHFTQFLMPEDIHTLAKNYGFEVVSLDSDKQLSDGPGASLGQCSFDVDQTLRCVLKKI